MLLIGNHVTGNCIMQGLGVHRNKTYPCKGCAQNCLENEGVQKIVKKNSSSKVTCLNCLQMEKNR